MFIFCVILLGGMKYIYLNDNICDKLSPKILIRRLFFPLVSRVMSSGLILAGLAMAAVVSV